MTPNKKPSKLPVWTVAIAVLLTVFSRSSTALGIAAALGLTAGVLGLLAFKRAGLWSGLVSAVVGAGLFLFITGAWLVTLPAKSAKHQQEAAIRVRLQGMLNQSGGTPKAATPSLSVPGGVYTDEVSVELNGPSATAVICYTVDGTEPTPNSLIYLGRLKLDRSALIKAKAFDEGHAPSATVSQTYTLVDKSLANFNSNLPLVIINTFGQPIYRENRANVSTRFINPVNGRSSLTGPANFDGRGQINLRGSSTLRLPKHSYTLHTRDYSEAKIKAPLLGFPKDSDWVLYAPYQDKTMIRDVLAYELSNRMGHYATRTKYVEVFVNRSGGRLGKRDYEGVYVLMEKIKRGKQRVHIEALTPEDNQEPAISGGYIFKRDHSDREEGGFYTRRGVQFFFVDPKEKELTPKQRAWLAGYLNQFENALYGRDFANPTNGYAAYLDVDSFIDQHLLIELSKNIDAFRYSAYLQKDRGGKIKVEPIWDWNLSFGNANYYEGWLPQRWYWPHLRTTEISWFRRLSQDPDFMQRCESRWGELRKNIFATSNLLARVDQLSASLHESQVRNYERWPILGQFVYPNWYVGQTYEDEIRWMKEWIRRRLDWMDQQLLSPSRHVPAPGESPSEASLEMLVPALGSPALLPRSIDTIPVGVSSVNLAERRE